MELDLLKTVKVVRRHVVELLRLLQLAVCASVLRHPHSHVGVGPVDLAHMTRQTLEVAVPVHGDEVRGAVAVARIVEVLQPREAHGGARHGRRAEQDALVLQGLDLAYPRRGGIFGSDAGAA